MPLLRLIKVLKTSFSCIVKRFEKWFFILNWLALEKSLEACFFFSTSFACKKLLTTSFSISWPVVKCLHLAVNRRSSCQLLTVWTFDISWAEWANSSFISLWKYWVAKSLLMVLNELPELDAPYLLVNKSIAILFSLFH